VGNLPPFQNFPLTNSSGVVLGLGPDIIDWIIPPGNQYATIGGSFGFNLNYGTAENPSGGVIRGDAQMIFTFSPVEPPNPLTNFETFFQWDIWQSGPGGSAGLAPLWSQISSQYPNTMGVAFAYASANGISPIFIASTVVGQGSSTGFAWSQSAYFAASWYAPQGVSSAMYNVLIDSITPGPLGGGAPTWYSAPQGVELTPYPVWDFGPLSTTSANTSSTSTSDFTWE
jgi:hypothetical protein